MLDPEKVKQLEQKLEEPKAPDLAEYDIPEEQLHMYHRATWEKVEGEHRHVFPYNRYECVEVAASQISDAIEERVNSPLAWKLLSIVSVAKRPGKHTGGSYYLLTFMTVLPYLLPKLVKMPVIVAPGVDDTAERAEKWEKEQSGQANEG